MINAQLDNPIKGFKIEPSDSILNVNKTKLFIINPKVGLSFKNVKNKLLNTPISSGLDKKSGVDISGKSTLKQKEWEIKQRFSEDRKDLEKYKRDYFLGNLKTTSKTVFVKFRDHEYVDGDKISFMLNKAMVHPNIKLTGQFYTIDIELREGINTIDFIALNEGSSSPNTAQVMVVDETGKVLVSNNWLIRTGYKASLVILKE